MTDTQRDEMVAMIFGKHQIFTGQSDPLQDVLDKIDFAIALLNENGNRKSILNYLSDAGNTLQCHIELNSDQSVRNTVSTK
jgi:hypothetical protein